MAASAGPPLGLVLRASAAAVIALVVAMACAADAIFVPVLLDFQPAVLAMDPTRGVHDQVTRFCASHLLDAARCGVLQAALSEVVSAEDADRSPCRPRADPTSAAFVLAKNVLVATDAPAQATATWTHDHPRNIATDVCAFLAETPSEMPTTASDTASCVEALDAAFTASFRWINALRVCGARGLDGDLGFGADVEKPAAFDRDAREISITPIASDVDINVGNTDATDSEKHGAATATDAATEYKRRAFRISPLLSDPPRLVAESQLTRDDDATSHPESSIETCLLNRSGGLATQATGSGNQTAQCIKSSVAGEDTVAGSILLTAAAPTLAVVVVYLLHYVVSVRGQRIWLWLCSNTKRFTSGASSHGSCQRRSVAPVQPAVAEIPLLPAPQAALQPPNQEDSLRALTKMAKAVDRALQRSAFLCWRGPAHEDEGECETVASLKASPPLVIDTSQERLESLPSEAGTPRLFRPQSFSVAAVSLMVTHRLPCSVAPSPVAGRSFGDTALARVTRLLEATSATDEMLAQLEAARKKSDRQHQAARRIQRIWRSWRLSLRTSRTDEKIPTLRNKRSQADERSDQAFRLLRHVRRLPIGISDSRLESPRRTVSTA